MISSSVLKLMKSFQGSFINENGEIIVDRKANTYFSLSTCVDETEIKCKVLEWLSYHASFAEPFKTRKLNSEYQRKILNGINSYLITAFCQNDMEWIYEEIGNSVNRGKTLDFIRSGYNLKVFHEAKV